MNTIRRNITFCLLLAGFVLSACRLGQLFGPALTPTPTSTPTATSTPTLTPTPSLTPTVTPIPLTVGSWSGVADGWKPPLTVSFSVSAEGNTLRVKDLKIYIPEIDMANFAATLVRTSCTIRVDSLEIVDNGFVYPAGAPEGARILEAQFNRDGAGVTGSLFGGWLCEDRQVQFYEVEWHAEAAP